MATNAGIMCVTASNSEVAVCCREHGRNGHTQPSGLFSWYLAEAGRRGPKYVLTGNGYVVLRTGISS